MGSQPHLPLCDTRRKQILADARRSPAKNRREDRDPKIRTPVAGQTPLPPTNGQQGWENEQEARGRQVPALQSQRRAHAKPRPNALVNARSPPTAAKKSPMMLVIRNQRVCDQAEPHDIQKAILYQMLGGSVSVCPVRSACLKARKKLYRPTAEASHLHHHSVAQGKLFL